MKKGRYMNGSRFAFIILHYLNYEDTANCIESILHNVKAEEKEIVVVDNASPNGSGKKLKDRYEGTQHVTVIFNSRNDGFARGNNVGFRYAKENLNPDYIILINNDTVIKQADFCEKIDLVHSESGFAVLGPQIISMVDGINQNPVPYALPTKWKVIRRLGMFCAMYLLSFVGCDGILSREKRRSDGENSLPSDYQLHGSCLIFSPEYISRFNGLYDGTFMYCEEDVLKYACVKNHLKMVYSGQVSIFHKEASATGKAFGEGVSKRKFYYKNTMHSLTELLLLMCGMRSF